ncbi:FAD-binding oxidoreductase [Streptosporangium sp. H16]|uniref:FAD-binding oxidoreductase n=1 Tax=Streptosporangium sp. H16 TaxID=3444184 RepID=UPI003F7903A6
MSSSSPVMGLDKLRETLDGVLVCPSSPGWDAARAAWQLAVDQRPVAVVRAASVRDVVATVEAAARLGLRVAPQATGHNAAPLGPLDGTILLRTSAMRGVTIDAERQIARVEAGALWADVTAAASAHGLTGLAGTAPDVGVVGYTLGGGLSWFARLYGLAANHVLSADIVTADGELRTIDATRDAALFWAIRGGGGSFGVVTALEFRLFPITQVHAGTLLWPIERAAEVLGAWREWVRSVPETVTSMGRLLWFPPIPQIPEPLRGRSFVAVQAACLLDPTVADPLFAPLRALGPELDTVSPTPITELGAMHMDPQEPTPIAGDGFQLAEFSPAALEALLRVVGPQADVPLLTVELRHLGGALAPGRPGGGAVSGMDAAFAVFSTGIVPDAGVEAAAHAVLDEMSDALAPWKAETAFRNFTERSGPRFDRLETHIRLQRIKADYDPTDLIHANHPVTPVG